MRVGGATVITFAVSASGTLLGLLVARQLGVPVPMAVVLACASVSAPLAVAVAIMRLVAFWRGPAIESFPAEGAVRCAAADAEAIRAAAQVRGTLGGAGHLYRARLALHAVACLAAAALAGTVLVSSRPEACCGWTLGAVAAVASVSALLPARPFYYREAMNGELLVAPPVALGLLARGNSPTPAPIARNPADVRLPQEQ